MKLAVAYQRPDAGWVRAALVEAVVLIESASSAPWLSVTVSELIAGLQVGMWRSWLLLPWMVQAIVTAPEKPPRDPTETVGDNDPPGSRTAPERALEEM
jgi:hypothetical protein